MSRFENKVALITGSSQGIGAACAVRLAQDGCDIVLNGRKLDDRGKALVAQIEKTGQRVKFIEADLADFSQISDLLSGAIAAFGQLDILVNNAGRETNKDFWEVTEEEYDEVMDLNVKSVFFATQYFVKQCMEKKIPGVVISMSSVHEEIAFPHFAAYCASKGALRMLTRNLASELSVHNIRVNNVAPGAIETPINKELLSNPQQLNGLLRNIPLKRMGKPEDVGSLVSFLASDDASYITGSTYFVDGGLTYHYEEQ